MTAFLLMAGLLFAAEPPTTRPTSAPAEEDSSLRVMTFNIRYGTAADGENHWERRREMVFDVIRTHRPDLVGTQEALRFQLDQIREAVGGFGEVGAARDDGKQSGEYSSILYREDRFQVLESGTFWLSETPEVPGSRHWGNTLPRVCSWAKLADRRTGGTVWFYNTHLDHMSQRSRQRGLELIASRIAALPADAAVILTGDFNAGEGNSAVRALLQEARPAQTQPAQDAGPATRRVKLVDTFRAVHPDEKVVGTFHGFKGSTTGDKIDYVLVSPGIETLEAAILRDHRDQRYPSDHYPVSARIRIRAGR